MSTWPVDAFDTLLNSPVSKRKVCVANNPIRRVRYATPPQAVRRLVGAVSEQYGPLFSLSQNWDVAYGERSSSVVGREMEGFVAVRRSTAAEETCIDGYVE